MERTEKTLSTIITTNQEYNEDLTEILIQEKEQKILYTTLLICTTLYLLTIISW